jgi:threonine synthase
MPEVWDPLPDMEELLALPWQARNAVLLERMLGDEFSRPDLEAMAQEVFDFPVPLVCVGESVFALELFHGPTLAFKDFGARFLAAVLARIGGGPRTVLTATSGDTGAAVASAFWQRPGFRVVILYPEGRVSPLQERQIACMGDNVEALAVQGSFDDCQRLAKSCFQDAALASRLGLTSANSINIARLVAQVLYYFEAIAQLRAFGENAMPLFAVPSGNFGNLCAGLLAKRLGMRADFLAATNDNRTVPDHLDTGKYLPRPSVATLSNAMDVGDPSNWERILHFFSHDLEALRSALQWGCLDDQATLAALRELHQLGYTADPHGGVAYGRLRRHRQADQPGVFLATAHPAKFREVLEARLSWTVELPPALADLLRKPLHSRRLPADLDALKAVLEGPG